MLDYIWWMDKHPTEDKILLGGNHSIAVADLDGELLTSIEGYRYIRQLNLLKEIKSLYQISWEWSLMGTVLFVLDIDTEEIVTEVIYHGSTPGDCVWSESRQVYVM